MPGIFLEDFLGTFSHKNEEKKSGEKIRGKIRQPKNKNPRKSVLPKTDPKNRSDFKIAAAISNRLRVGFEIR